jgi:hypothetical protein
MMNSRKVSSYNEDFLEYKIGDNEMVYAGFSISNSTNERDKSIEYIKYIVSNGGICVVPNELVCLGLTGNESTFINNVYTDAYGSDWAYNPWDFHVLGFGVCRLTDLAFSILGEEELHELDEYPFVTNCAYNNIWMCVYPIEYVANPVENPLNTTTQMVKGWSTQLRYQFQLGTNTSYRARLLAGERHGAIAFSRRDSYIQFENGIYPFAVSGHLVNIVMRSCLGLFDLNLYLLHITSNTKGAYEFSVEGQPSHWLWHSYIEYRLALDSAEILIEDLGIVVSCRFDYVISRLRKLADEYPILTTVSPDVISYFSPFSQPLVSHYYPNY